ncbi:MAG TPA: hypothetical protein VFV65_04160, partial [Gemmatimonadales bacterium]|nr:hypothetical protein [Gemmatimonadales bacterium]
MSLDRRQFTGLLAGMVVGSACRPEGEARAATRVADGDPCDPPPPIKALRPMLDGVEPITAAERARRLDR